MLLQFIVGLLVGLFIFFLSSFIWMFFRYRWYMKYKVWYIACTVEYLHTRIALGDFLSKSECMATLNAWGSGDFDNKNYDTRVLASTCNDMKRFIKDKYRFKKVADYIQTTNDSLYEPNMRPMIIDIEKIKEEIRLQVEILMHLKDVILNDTKIV